MLAVWRAGTACILATYLYTYVKQHLQWRKRMPCNSNLMRAYVKICSEMGGKRFPNLYQSYGVKVPVFAGIVHPAIYLPVSNWTQEQLHVILIHELNHFRQRDLWLKRIALLLVALHWLNPAVWIFQRLVILWSEYSCDWLCYPMCGGKKAYFQVITALALEQGKMFNNSTSTLFANSSELEQRIQYLKSCGKKRKGVVWVSALLAAIMILTGAGTAFASVQAAGKAYYEIFKKTDVCVEESPSLELKEYQDNGFAPWIREEIGDVVKLDGRSVADAEFNWELGINVAKKTGSFYVSSGKQISVMVFITPNTESIRAGIIKNGGKRSYAKISNGGSHTFNITESGYYQVFVENLNSRIMNVSGLYKIS
ncbi:MAG: M56 family metallopeptidase [Eubacterium sp.]|nr:M56 family metallopeptidase [Eubacterium sp.]